MNSHLHLLNLRKLLLTLSICLNIGLGVEAQTPAGTNVTFAVHMELNLMFTDVVINGETFKFLIDTGAPFLLSPETAEKVGFRSDYLTVLGSSNSKMGRTEVGSLPHKVVVGGVALDPPKKVYVTDYNANTQLIRCLEFDGILGSNIMKDAIWHFDYDNQQVQITKKLKNIAGIKNASQAKMRVNRKTKKPYVWGKINDYFEGDFLFDTGYGGFVDWPHRIYKNVLESTDTSEGYEMFASKGIASEGAFGAEDTTNYDMKTAKVMIGKELLQAPVIEVSHSRSSKVGVEYMMGRLVTFDFKRKKWYVQQKEDAYLSEDFSHYLVSFTLNDSTVQIASVSAEMINSEIVKSGDQVLAADGRDFFNSEPCKNTFWLRERARKGTKPLRLKLKRGEEVKEITLEKKQVFKR